MHNSSSASPRCAWATGLAALALTAALAGCPQQDGAPATRTSSSASPGSSSTSGAAAGSTSERQRLSNLGRLFAGLPSRGNVGHRLLTIVGASDLAVRIPPGWKSETVGGATQVREKDRRALASFKAGFDRISQQDIDAAARSLGFEDASWTHGTDAQLGSGRLPGTASQGEAKLGGEPAITWFLDVEVSGGKRMLVMAGGQRAADDARGALIECLRSVHTKK